MSISPEGEKAPKDDPGADRTERHAVVQSMWLRMSRWTRKMKEQGKPLGPVTPVPGLAHGDKELLRRLREWQER